MSSRRDSGVNYKFFDFTGKLADDTSVNERRDSTGVTETKSLSRKMKFCEVTEKAKKQI